MSYSFNKSAPNKTELMALVAQALEEVVAQQPIHAADRAQAEATVQDYVDILPDPTPEQYIQVSVHGSVSYTAENVVTASNIGVGASIINREPHP